MKKTSLTLTLAIMSGMTVTAWAEGEHEGGHGANGNAEVERTISVEAGDMWFDPEEMNIAPGETVKFEITNTGSIEHEFVIGDESAQEAHREMMQEMGSHGDGGHGGHGGHDMAEGEHGCRRLPSARGKPEHWCGRHPPVSSTSNMPATFQGITNPACMAISTCDVAR